MADSMSTRDEPSRAQETKEEAKQQMRDVTDSVSEHAGAVTQEAKGKAVDVMHDVRNELQTQGDTQAKRAASALHDVSGQLEAMANGGQPGAVTHATRQLAGRSRQLANRLEHGGMQGIGDDLAAFARRQPLLFLTAAGVAGFVVTRMLRNAPSLSATSSPDAGQIGYTPPVPSLPSSQSAPQLATAAPSDVQPSAIP